jgi:hypothetical protein
VTRSASGTPSHVMPDMQREASDKMEELLFKGGK